MIPRLMHKTWQEPLPQLTRICVQGAGSLNGIGPNGGIREGLIIGPLPADTLLVLLENSRLGEVVGISAAFVR